MYSAEDAAALPAAGFPIQKSSDLSLFSGSPKLIAAYHVFLRLLTPRHPPYALSSLIKCLRNYFDQRYYNLNFPYVIFKERY